MKKNIKNFNIYLEKSILSELKRDLAFGCVNKDSNGSRTDMTYHTFLDSSQAIRKSLETLDRKEIRNFYDLRKAGIYVEKSMYQKTQGVNTHKGLVFLLMFLAYFYTNYGQIRGYEK